MERITKPFLAVIVVSMLAVGCESGPRVQMAPGYETTPTRQEVEANVMGTPESTKIPPTPTPEPLALDDTLYTVPSQLFSFYIPQGWIVAVENEDYVRFEAPDQKAWFDATVESTAYQLSQSDLENYMDAILVSLYGGLESYELIDSQIDEGWAAYISTNRKNGFNWTVYDVFVQRSQAVYALSFHALDMVWDAYLPGFQAVVESLETRTAYVTDEMIYSDGRIYTGPNNQFTLNIPMGWTFSLGQDIVEGALVDVISSPDQQAAVEVIAYDGTEDLLTVDIGQISIPIMKQLDGEDMRIRANEVLNDGRVRVDWQVDETDMRGFSFFWQDESIVYILTFKFNDKNTGAYQNVAYGIGDSFAFTSGN